MDRELLDRASAWVETHFEELVNDLCELVRIPSVSGCGEEGHPYGRACFDALKWFETKARAFGLQTNIVDGRVIEVSPSFGENPIALWNHLDVVPAADGWTYTQPFEPLRIGEMLIGRGADDNKGPAVASLYLLRMLRELNVTTKHPIQLCAGTDEEKGMSDVLHYVRVRPEAALNVVADCGFPVCFAEKGILETEVVSKVPLTQFTALEAGTASNIVPDRAFMRIASDAPVRAAETENVTVSRDGGLLCLTARGVPAHSAHPQAGVNAIHVLTKYALSCGILDEESARAFAFFTRVNDTWDGSSLGISFSDGISGETTCAGTMLRLRPDGRASLHLNIRYAISQDDKAMLDSIGKACEESGLCLENARVSRPNYYPPESEVVQAMTRVFNTLAQKDAKPYAMAGGTYARKLKNAFGFGMGGLEKPASVRFEPGHGGAHQADEALYLPNLKRGMVILFMALLEADKTV